MDLELEIEWKKVLEKLKSQFGDDMDVQAILFLIGVQELGKGFQIFSKDQKVEIIHVAICTLLAPLGYYEYQGMDKDGWPHWKAKTTLPALKPGEQRALMKKTIIAYFHNRENSN